jgi:flagellar hook assembly protein FlgD
MELFKLSDLFENLDLPVIEIDVQDNDSILSPLVYTNVFPNPTNGSCRISSSLLNKPDSRIEIYSSLGQLVFQTPASEIKGDFVWDTNSSDGKPVYSGMYYCVIRAQEEFDVIEIQVLLR